MFKHRKTIKILIIAMIAALAGIIALTACTNNPDGSKATLGPAATLPPQQHEEVKPYEGPFGKTITLAANSANTINGYYNDFTRSKYILENPNTKITYNLSTGGYTGLGSIENSKGGVYITDTMETYMRSTDGVTFYSGGSTARANLYDQGFYYYNLHILDQVFMPGDDMDFEKYDVLDLRLYYAESDIESTAIDADGVLTFKVASPRDPYICFKLPDNTYKVGDYDAFVVTMKSRSSDVQLFYIAGNNDEFSGDAHIDFKAIPDGEYHTYVVYYRGGGNLIKNFKGYRLDVGSTVGEEIGIKEVALAKMDSGTPQFKLDRNYNMFPDKVHENVRFVATSLSSNIDAVGTITKIPEGNVAKFIVGDKNGDHEGLEGVDWDSAAYVGFDIKDAGVFGVILGTDATYSGKLSLELKDGFYVLTQELAWGGKKVKNGGDIIMARRLYNDETHDFAAFLAEAFAERNPVEFTVETEGTSKLNSYLGYDQLTGRYLFRIRGVTTFDGGYEHPLDEHRVRFTATPNTETPRTVYVCGECTTDGCLECAVVLGDNNMLLPIRVEVCKNFAHDGEELFYTDDDSHAYGLSLFPMVVESGGNNTLTLANLYEQWGNYRLKQISSIRWHTAYYHLSLGVTETNCINIYSTGNRLPDHRGLSSPYWSDVKVDVVDAAGNPTGKTRTYDLQPQHSNNGNHIFLRYTDADGVYNSLENIGQTMIDSAGPDLSDVTLYYTSFDGKVYQKYRHVEMPSTDENRAFYEIDLEFLQDLSIKDIRHDFSIYEFSGGYGKFGYLNKDGQCVIEDAKKDGTRVIELGKDFPYFDYFGWITSNPRAYIDSDVCSNLSCLLKSYDITIGGKQYDGGFAVLEGNNAAALTLNLSGAVTFKKGDHIRLSCIMMPWGDYHSENDDNVRIVRENTLLNPIKLEVAAGKLQADDVVPTVRSDDGRTCEFTISGGKANVRDLPGYATAEYTKYKSTWERDYNVTVRMEGMKNLGVPKIYELVDGSWIEYKVASDKLGYDGYTVDYAADGTFTYGFTVTMTEARARTFKIECA